MDYTKLTDAQLESMTLAELTSYSQTVSTAVGLQYSSIVADQVVQAQYQYMILTSQSTINGLGYEITANNNAIIAADVRMYVLHNLTQITHYSIRLLVLIKVVLPFRTKL